MKKFLYITVLIVTIITSYNIGKYTNTVDKYNYLDLNSITLTEIDGEAVTIHTIDGDNYLIFGINR